MNVGYINPEVRAMYGIPYNQLTAKQKKILHEDSVRRAKLIQERENDVLKNDRKAFDDEAKMERVLASLYKDCQKQILARVAETIAKVEKAGGEWSYANQSALTRSKGLFEQINEQIKALGQKEEITFRQGLGNIYTDQFLRELYSMGQVQNVKVNFNSLNPTYIKKAIDYPWSGAMFSDRLWIDKENLGRNLRLGLTQSMVLGEGIPQITERINKNINTSQYNAERVARTETVRVSYVAKSEIWGQNGVEQLRYRSANGGDSRACSTCKADNGKVFDKGTEPTLPRHPNCRCTYIPVAKDTFGDNELNELTGSVRGAENYDKWKKEYEVALNPDGSYKDGWGRDKDFKVKYTTKDGRKLTLDEYKAEFVDKPVNPTPVKGGVTVTSVENKYKELYDKYVKDISRVRSSSAVDRITNQYLSDIGSPIKRVNLSTADVATAKDISKHLVELDSKWVSTLEEVDIVDHLATGIGGSCRPYEDRWMRTHNDKDLYSRINYSWKEINPRDAERYKGYNDRAFPISNHGTIVDDGNSVLSTVYHEYGHSILGGKVSEILGTNKEPFEAIKEIERRYKEELSVYKSEYREAQFRQGKYKDMPEDEVNKVIENSKKHLAEIFVSEYSLSSTGEFIAESFTNASLCSKPSKYAVEVLNVLKKYFGK